MSAPKDLTASQVIDALEKFYETHEWTTYSWARNATGEKVRSHADDACSWCAMGAMDRLGFSGGPAVEAMFDLCCNAYGRSLAGLNDSCNSSAELIAKLREAVAP